MLILSPIFRLAVRLGPWAPALLLALCAVFLLAFEAQAGGGDFPPQQAIQAPEEPDVAARSTRIAVEIETDEDGHAVPLLAALVLGAGGVGGLWWESRKRDQ